MNLSLKLLTIFEEYINMREIKIAPGISYNCLFIIFWAVLEILLCIQRIPER